MYDYCGNTETAKNAIWYFLRPKAKRRGGLFGEGPVPIKASEAWKPPKMHTVGINFISFTA